MSENEESESYTSSSEDEGPPEISENFEKSFFKTLSSLKNDDPTIYDHEKKFFEPTDVVNVVKKKVKKNKRTNQLDYLEKDDDEETKSEHLPYTVEQSQLKESFKSFINDSDEDGDLLVPLKKSKQDIEKEEADYIQWLKGQKQDINDSNTKESLKNLREYWNSNTLDEDESFLRDYILNKRFLDKDESEEEDFSEDSETLEKQEEFEKEYNFRYETDENIIRRFPRNVDNSLRRKNNKRSLKRQEIHERKKQEKNKKQEEINRQKNLKAKEIAERLEKLKELTGNEKLAFNDNDIIEDFNAEEHDKKMNEMFNDEYYKEEDDDKPGIDDLDFGNDYGEMDDDGDYYDDDNYEEAGPSRKERKKTRTKRKKERKKKSFTEIANIEKPIYDPKLHESYQKYMDEYYQLDCEDFIYDMPCRFKYRQVEPNDYGLSIEEILAADDKELNKWSSLKKIQKIRPPHVERNEVKIYQMKAKNDSIKRKVLPSLYKIEEEDNNYRNDNTSDNETRNNLEEKLVNSKKKNKKKKKSDQVNNHEVLDVQSEKDSDVNPEVKKNKKQSNTEDSSELYNNNEIDVLKEDFDSNNAEVKKKKNKSDNTEILNNDTEVVKLEKGSDNNVEIKKKKSKKIIAENNSELLNSGVDIKLENDNDHNFEAKKIKKKKNKEDNSELFDDETDVKVENNPEQNLLVKKSDFEEMNVEDNIKNESFSNKRKNDNYDHGLKNKRMKNSKEFSKDNNFKNQNNKTKFKKYNRFNKKNHDFHDSRLSAYGLNPKKFKVKT